MMTEGKIKDLMNCTWPTCIERLCREIIDLQDKNYELEQRIQMLESDE